MPTVLQDLIGKADEVFPYLMAPINNGTIKKMQMVPVHQAEIAGRVFEVFLDPKAIAVMDEDGRSEIQRSADKKWLAGQLEKSSGEIVEVATPTSGIRWASGGIMHVLLTEGQRYFLLARRSEDTRNYRGYLDMSGGISQSLWELLCPSAVAWREGIEEVILVEKGIIKVLQPSVPLFPSPVEMIFPITRLLGLDYPISMTEDFHQIKTGHEYLIRTIWEGKHGSNFTTETEAVVGFDPETSGASLLIPVEIPVSSLDDIKFYDGEDDSRGGLLHRDIVLIPWDQALNDNINKEALVFKNGRLCQETKMDCHFTPVAQTVLDALRD